MRRWNNLIAEHFYQISEKKLFSHLSVLNPDIMSMLQLFHTDKVQHWFCVLLIFQTLHTKEPPLKIPYNKNCQYKFQYSVQTDQYCIPLSSDLSEVITHGNCLTSITNY